MSSSNRLRKSCACPLHVFPAKMTRPPHRESDGGASSNTITAELSSHGGDRPGPWRRGSADRPPRGPRRGDDPGPTRLAFAAVLRDYGCFEGPSLQRLEDRLGLKSYPHGRCFPVSSQTGRICDGADVCRPRHCRFTGRFSSTSRMERWKARQPCAVLARWGRQPG